MNNLNEQSKAPNVKDFYVPSRDQIKKLREILINENAYRFSYDETKEVAYGLIRLYECLAQEQPIIPEGVEHD